VSGVAGWAGEEGSGDVRPCRDGAGGDGSADTASEAIGNAGVKNEVSCSCDEVADDDGSVPGASEAAGNVGVEKSGGVCP